jgi:chloramphenicol 3-O phosphotransferase
MANPIAQQPLLIVLNGASSSGKTVTGRALVDLLGRSCKLTGLDDILEREQPLGAEVATGIGALSRTLRVLWFQVSDGRLKLFKQLHCEVAAAIESGQHVVVDTALLDNRALADAAARFAPLGGYFIGMKPPLEISETWERGRGDRPTGQARKHYALIHSHNTYDLVIDPSTMTPLQCAETILRYTRESPAQAFRQLAVAPALPS